MRYVLLTHPGHNRIYHEKAFEIAMAEIKAIAGARGIAAEALEIGCEGLPNAIVFSLSEDPDEKALKALGASSAFYSLFEDVGHGMLKPLKVPEFRIFPEKMTQLLKYNGKTNERFTRLMVNLAVSACKTGAGRITLLDPMCGKGTTLYEGFIRGFDVLGIELNKKWSREVQTFVIRFMKEGRYKHKAAKFRRTDGSGRKMADGFEMTAAADKEAYKKGDGQHFRLFHGDTRKTDLLVGKASCDCIVCDLPYGVQHGSKGGERGKLDRSPAVLLKESLPTWRTALKSGGSLVLSFNEFTLRRKAVADLMEESGFRLQGGPEDKRYLHRVDQAINRNLAVAVSL